MWFSESEANICDVFDKAHAAASCVMFFWWVGLHCKSPWRRQWQFWRCRWLCPQPDLDGKWMAWIWRSMSSSSMQQTGLTKSIWPFILDIRSADLCSSSWQTLASVDLKAAFNKLLVSTDVNLAFLAKNMHGYSGANLTEICQRATKLAIWESINSDIWKQQERKAKEEAADDDTNMEEDIKRNFLFLRFVNNPWTRYCGNWLIVLWTESGLCGEPWWISKHNQMVLW